MSGPASQARAWYWHRISAMILAICVMVHLGIIIYAVRGGLTGAEILARTSGNWGFGAFYSVFVLACAVHVPIGLANIAQEWLGWSEASSRIFTIAAGVLILLMGFSSVYGVIVS